MSSLLTNAEQLVVMQCWCGIQHAVPESLRDEQKRQHDAGASPVGIFCPLGHSHIPAGKSEGQKLREELQRERQNRDQREAFLRDDRDRALRQKAAAQGQVTKFKRLIAKGVCPCCRRSFVNLRRHMANQHPQFDPEKSAEMVSV